jgi:hypothetical protein
MGAVLVALHGAKVVFIVFDLTTYMRLLRRSVYWQIWDISKRIFTVRLAKLLSIDQLQTPLQVDCSTTFSATQLGA